MRNGAPPKGSAPAVKRGGVQESYEPQNWNFSEKRCAEPRSFMSV